MGSIKNDDINDKLRMEEAWLSQLKENLEKSQSNKDRMIGLLDSFTTRLEKLEGTILPLYEHTGQLQRRQQNINDALSTVDSTLGFYNIANEVESTIRETEPVEDLDRYIGCMNKLLDATQFFKSHKATGSNQLENVRLVFDTGCHALERQYRQILRQNCSPIPAETVLRCIDDNYEPVNEESIVIIPETSIENLSKISTWFSSNDLRSEFKDIFAEIQSQNLKHTMVSISQARSAEFAAGTAAPGAQIRSSMLPPAAPSGARKESLSGRFAGGIRKKVTRGYTVDSGAKRQTALAFENVRESPEDFEAETLILLFTSFLLLRKRYAETMERIFSENESVEIQRFMLGQSFVHVLDHGDGLMQHIRRSQSKQDHASMFCLFHVAAFLRSKADLPVVAQEYLSSLFSRFQEFCRTVDSLCVKGLEDFVEHIKSDQDRGIPKDGTVHQISSNALMFLEQLLEFRHPLGIVLTGEQDDPKVKALAVPKYFARVLSALGLNLRTKGEVYSDSTLKALFMLNNFNHILKSLHKSGGLRVVSEQNREVGGYYETQIKEYKTQYFQCWTRLLSYIVDNRQGYSPNLDRLRDKERQAIKDGFAGFNKELENVTQTQRNYSVPDVELATAIIRESKDLIVPKYTTFYNNYQKAQFSKNPEKYVRYTPPDVSAVLDHLFSARGR